MKTKRLILLAALMLMGASFLWADDNTVITSDAEMLVQTHRAPVVVDGHVLFAVRGASAYPAEQRAAAISQRVKEAAKDVSLLPSTPRLDPAPNATTIFFGNTLVMRVFDADANLEHVTRPVLSELYSQRISTAITAYRRDREPRLLLIHLLHAGIATFILLIVLGGVWGCFHYLNALAQRHIKSAIDQLQSKVSSVFRMESLWSALIGVLNLIKGLIYFGAAYAYLAYVLELFPWTRSFGEALLSTLLEPLQRIGHGCLTAFPGLVFVAVVALVARYALKVLRLLFTGIERGRIEWANFDREWAWPTYKIIRVMVIAFAAVVAYPYIPGSSTDAFKGITLLLGLIFSLGSSSVISNVVAGYSMTYRRTFKLGDIIRVGEVFGVVADIGLMVTRIRTLKNEDVVVPNSQILNTHVVNYSTLAKKDGLVLHTKAGIGYETSWRQVEAMMKIAASRTPGLLKTPAPFVLIKELADFAVTYELNVYCDTPQLMPKLYTALHKNVLDLFNEYGVQIMTPAYEGDPDERKVVPKDKWFAAPAARDAKVETPEG